MKHLYKYFGLLLLITLFGCSPAEEVVVEPTEAAVPAPTTEEMAMPEESLIEESSALIGTWFGAGGGGWMLLREDGTFRGAFLRDELVNSEPDDTAFWKGTYQFEAGELRFMESSTRCQQGQAGNYQAYRREDGTVRFELVDDDCKTRANGMVGQQSEPVFDLLWEKVSEEAPHSFDWFKTIELPFVPHDIEVDGSGNIFVIELGAPRVHKLDQDGNVLVSWGEAGQGEGEFAFAPPPDGPELDGGFLVTGESGRLYISDSFNNRVQVFTSEGEFQETWTSYGPDETAFNIPGPISVDGSGNVYVADFDGVHQFDANGGYVKTIPAAGEVALNSQGDLFSTITFEHMVIKFPAGGGDPVSWGGEGVEPGQFVAPLWVAVRPDDSVYYSDHSGRLQKFNSEGKLLGMWWGPEQGEGPFMAPLALTMAENGNLYLATKDRAKIYLLSQ